MESTMRYAITVTASCLFLSACSSMTIGEAMRACDTGKDFSNYASCLKTTYAKKGDGKDTIAIRAFNGYVNEISNAYKNGQMTHDHAMDQVYSAYENTVKSDSDGKGVKVCGISGGDLICR